MRKPVYAICEQQRRRSVCASAQSDQRLFSSLPSVICMCTCYSCTRDEAHILSLTMTAGPYISVPMLPAVTMEFGVAFVLESLV